MYLYRSNFNIIFYALLIRTKIYRLFSDSYLLYMSHIHFINGKILKPG